MRSSTPTKTENLKIVPLIDSSAKGVQKRKSEIAVFHFFLKRVIKHERWDMDEHHVETLISTLQHGTDEEKEAAARVIFDRYYTELVRLALSRMNPQLRRRVDESRADSALRSVLFAMIDGRLTPSSSDELEKLLVFSTVRKVQQSARYHNAKKRNIHRDQNIEPVLLQMAASDPADEDAEWLHEAIEHLDPLRKEVVVLYLEGFSTGEIAELIGRTSVTVRNRLEASVGELRKLLVDEEH